MLHTVSFTKLLGMTGAGVLGFYVVNQLGGMLYTHPGETVIAYPVIEDEDETVVAEQEPAAELSFAELLAAADPAAGERVFKECRACHKIEEGVHSVGPSLHGVVGRAVQSFDDFRYSGALEGTADVWTPEAIDAFIADPRGYAPGTAMTFAGLRDAEDRANVIAYLQSIGN